MLYLSSRAVSHVSMIGARGQQRSYDSRLDVACIPDVVRDGVLACTAYDGSRTHIVNIASGSDRVVSVGFIEGRFVTDRSGVEGWLTGWIGARPAAIHLPTGAVLQISASMRPLRLMPVSRDRLAVLTISAQRMKAAVYAPLTANGRAGEPLAQNGTRAARP